MLDLNDVQEGVLNVAFRVADEKGLTLIDMKDLRALLDAIVPAGGKADGEDVDHLEDIRKVAQSYGNVSKATVGTIQRQLLVLENQGGTKFFGEPPLSLKDFMKTDSDGRGYVNILAADKLMQSPRLYATFLLWMLSELFEELPEAGDLPKPKLVFFFDEAHLLFTDAPKALMDKIEQVVRLIRSKGVGVYFVTQNPADIPEKVLAQLGNRVQHALRAYTPQEQKAVKVAATTFRENPKVDTEKAITELAVGEVLISLLDEKGVPTMVDRAFVVPPEGHIGPITPEQRQQLMSTSLVAGIYDQAVDRESAFELLQRKAEEKAAAQEQATAQEEAAKQQAEADKAAKAAARAPDSMWETIGKSVARSASSSIGRQIGTQIVRGVLGSILGGGSKKKSSWF